MEDLRVPKRAVRVEVVLPGGEARQVSIYLSEGAATHPGPERLSDLLNGSAPFIPARGSGTGAMTFLHRASIAVARVAAMEVLLVTSSVANLIREGKTFQIPSVMQTAEGELKQLFERNDIRLPA